MLPIVFDSHGKYFSQLVVWDFGGQLWPLGPPADPILVLITTDPSTLLRPHKGRIRAI